MSETAPTTATRPDPTTVKCHRKGCNSMGWRYLHNNCSTQKHKDNWSFCQPCFEEQQRKSREATSRSQKKRTVHKGLIKGAHVLQTAGIKLLVPDNAPDDIKKLVQDMGVDTQEREVIRTGSSASADLAYNLAPVRPNKGKDKPEDLMSDCPLADAVFDDFDIDEGQLKGGFFSTEYTYQIICAGMKLYHAGHAKLQWITSPQRMVAKNTNLAKYCAWKDGENDKNWKQTLHTLMGGIPRAKKDINALVLEDLIKDLLNWYVGQNNVSKTFVKFGILRTEKPGRQVSK